MSSLMNMGFVSCSLSQPEFLIYVSADLQGKWGIRISSTFVVKYVETKRNQNEDVSIAFRRLNCVPIQTRMVKESMLSKEEKHWLKVY